MSAEQRRQGDTSSATEEHKPRAAKICADLLERHAAAPPGHHPVRDRGTTRDRVPPPPCPRHSALQPTRRPSASSVTRKISPCVSPPRASCTTSSWTSVPTWPRRRLDHQADVDARARGRSASSAGARSSVCVNLRADSCRTTRNADRERPRRRRLRAAASVSATGASRLADRTRSRDRVSAQGLARGLRLREVADVRLGDWLRPTWPRLARRSATASGPAHEWPWRLEEGFRLRR